MVASQVARGLMQGSFTFCSYFVMRKLAGRIEGNRKIGTGSAVLGGVWGRGEGYERFRTFLASWARVEYILTASSTAVGSSSLKSVRRMILVILTYRLGQGGIVVALGGRTSRLYSGFFFA